MRFDPARVAVPPQADLAGRGVSGMPILNDVARWRRRARFDALAAAKIAASV